MKSIHYLLILVSFVLLYSCSVKTSYAIQFQNKTQYKLDSVEADIMNNGFVKFQLKKDEKSDVFTMITTGSTFFGPSLLYYSVKKYSLRDSVFNYPYGNMMDSGNLYEKKVNLISIEIDSAGKRGEVLFKFVANK